MNHYFASDIHLGAGGEAFAGETERRFVAWLDDAAKDAESIFLVGDLFDFWFEYREVVPKGFVRTLGKLAELTDRGVRVVFFTGNHDMWVGDYLAREYAAGHDVDHFVFGHMHFPRDFREGNLHVINLGCWEQYPSYAVLDASGEMTLRRLEAFR